MENDINKKESGSLFSNLSELIRIRTDNFKSNRIKELREEQHISQRQMAKLTDIKQANISRWEQGLNIPNVVDCCILAAFFNVDLDYLVGISI